LQANLFVKEELLRLLEPLMPRALPHTFTNTAGAAYSAAVRFAIAQTLDSLNTQFCELHDRSGCTCTVALFTGGLLTVANLGDSDAVLDAFSEIITMTVRPLLSPNIQQQSSLAVRVIHSRLV
jgi:serine/threonine protein phosphatase PrpC